MLAPLTLAHSPFPVLACADWRADIAAEDRNLRAEADDIDATVDALVAVNAALYPPLLLGLTTLPTCVN